MKLRSLTLSFAFLSLFAAGALSVFAAEYTGQFDTTLAANVEDHERVVFKPDSGERLKSAGSIAATAHIVIGKLIDPRNGQQTLLTFLVEEKGSDPALYVDLNEDHVISPDEKIVMKRRPDDTYLWNANILLNIKEGIFKTCPIYVQYFKSVRTDKMGPEDRLMTQSTEVLARGKVNVKGKDILVQYAYNINENKVTPQTGWIGVDIDSDGEIDMDGLSPEAAKANEEVVVFRVGTTYISTKKADVSKNQITLREHDAKEYKRLELYINKDFPDFEFTDFDGKKHRFSEFRGKYVLLDIWGFWCGPCRRELPYIREANKRFKDRNLQVVGLNTDEDYTIDSMKKGLRDSSMDWTQAQYQSVQAFLRAGLRVNSFPTTFLISPDGKILSMSRADRDEPDLRQSDLLDSLDKILPKQ